MNWCEKRERLSYFRDAYRILPYQRSTYGKSRAVLAAFQHTIDDLPTKLRSKVIDFPEIGIDPDTFTQPPERQARKSKTILFAGRLVPYKLPQILVQAFVKNPALHKHRIIIAGDGPERAAIERLIRSAGLESKILLVGWKSQREVATLMREADIFAFPSIRELGAGVVIEAMACGLACVVVDYGAPGRLIGSDRGIKVPLASADELQQSFGRALEHLTADEQTPLRLGTNARQFATNFFSWDRKARKLLDVYEWVLGNKPKPDFWKID